MPHNNQIKNTANAAGVTVRALEDWVTMEEAGQLIGISRSGVAYLIFHAREFDIDKDVRKIGFRGVVVVRKSAVLKKKREREADERVKEQADATKVQHRQVIKK